MFHRGGRTACHNGCAVIINFVIVIIACNIVVIGIDNISGSA